MKATDGSAMRIGAWRLDPALDQISKDGNTVKLERRATELLVFLAEHAGQVVSVEQLLAHVWAGVVVTPDSVYHVVASLRRILGDDTKDPTYIANVPRRGYRLVAPVTPLTVAPSVTLEPAHSAVEPLEPPLAAGKAGSSWRRFAAVLFIALLIVVGFALVERLSRLKPVIGRPPATAVMTAVPDKSIAVLPFLDMSEKKDEGYFADGITEELVELLSQVPDLRVPARTSSFYFKGKTEKIATIAQELGVAHVLEGSVRKSGSTLRVTARLIRADNGYHLWSKSYDRDVQDLFQVQDEIAAAVVDALKAKLLPPQRAATSYRTANAEAYTQYLLGNQFMRRNTYADYGRAAEAYRKAIALDPGYVGAFAGLANAVAWKSEDNVGMDEAVAAAERAVDLAPNVPDGYVWRGYLRYSYSWDWAGAEADFKKALAFDANNRDALINYSLLLATALDRRPEAVATARKAVELDPLNGEGWVVVGFALYVVNQFPAARQALDRALEINPDNIFGQYNRAIVELLDGQPQVALTRFRQLRDSAFNLTGAAMAEYTLGHAKESRDALDEAIAKNATSAAYQIAEGYAWCRAKDQAFIWLDRAYMQRDAGLATMRTDALLASLHGDPRYKLLLGKLNLPE